jgi:hypothetical protein
MTDARPTGSDEVLARVKKSLDLLTRSVSSVRKERSRSAVGRSGRFLGLGGIHPVPGS